MHIIARATDIHAIEFDDYSVFIHPDGFINHLMKAARNALRREHPILQ